VTAVAGRPFAVLDGASAFAGQETVAGAVRGNYVELRLDHRVIAVVVTRVRDPPAVRRHPGVRVRPVACRELPDRARVDVERVDIRLTPGIHGVLDPGR